MAFDAILRNLAVIGEAVRALPDETISSTPSVPWTSIAGLRNIVENYLDQLAQALRDASI
jgi:uncharacterized protein with HEPN domain